MFCRSGGREICSRNGVPAVLRQAVPERRKSVKNRFSAGLNILTIFTAMAVLLTGSVPDTASASAGVREKYQIDSAQPSTLAMPAAAIQKIDASYTVPQLTDDASLPYSITVKGKATGVRLSQAFDPDVKSYDLNALAVGQTVTIHVKAPADAAVAVNGSSVAPNQDYGVKITKISQDESIVVEIRLAHGTQKKYTIRTYNSSIPTLNYTVAKAGAIQNGIYTFALSSYLIRMNTAGEVIYYRSFSFLSKQKAALNLNFKPVQYTDGTKRFTYTIGVDNLSTSGGYTNGTCVVMNQDYQELEYINLEPYGWHQEGYLDDHDFILLSDTHWICESYMKRDVNNISGNAANYNGTGKVLAGVIQEVNNGKVVMEFDTSNYPFLYETSQEKNNFISGTYQDYCHVNSLFIDPQDQNLIVSMRNQYAVYKINRKTGKIMWVLGGKADEFQLSQNQTFLGQHAAYLTGSGSLLLFDNHTSKGQSRLMEFYLDENGKSVKYLRSETVADFYGDYCGNVFQTESGSYLVDWGLCTAHTSPVFTEVDSETGAVLSCLYTEGTQSYRAYKTDF